MEYRQLFVSKTYFVVAITILLCISGCRSTQEAQNSSDIRSDVARSLSDSGSMDTDTENEAGSNTASTSSNPLIITYQNASSNIQISLDPAKDEFYLDLKGVTPNEKDSVVVVDSAIIEERAVDIQALLSSYRKAQDLFYLGEYRNALEEVDKTLEIQETADAFALKGTIFFMLDNLVAARANWNRAVQIDPDIPVPSIPELESLINELREGEDQ